MRSNRLSASIALTTKALGGRFRRPCQSMVERPQLAFGGDVDVAITALEQLRPEQPANDAGVVHGMGGGPQPARSRSRQHRVCYDASMIPQQAQSVQMVRRDQRLMRGMQAEQRGAEAGFQ